MKPRTFHILSGALVLTLALLACNLPGGDGAEPVATQPSGQIASPTVEDAAQTATETGACPTVSLSPNPSGLISAVTLAEGTSGEDRNPVNPTTTFATGATFHAVVSVFEAPVDTTLKAVWFASDTAGVAPCNTQIDTFELVTDGTRNIDFSLTPEATWPSGSYRIEVYTNNVLDQAVYFSVK